jgi:hypothetical protein
VKTGGLKIVMISTRTLSTFPGVKTNPRPVLTDQDQRLLDGVQVRLLRPDERISC